MMYWKKSCFRVFSIIFFSSSKSFLYQWVKKFLLHQIRNNLRSEFSECFWKLVVEVYSYYCQPWETFRKFTCQCVTRILQINSKLYYFVVIFRSPFFDFQSFFQNQDKKMNLKELCSSVSIKSRFSNIYKFDVVIFFS